LGCITLLLLVQQFAYADSQDGKLEVELLAPGVYLHTSYQYLDNYGYFPSNGLVIVDGEDAHLIDTPWPVDDTERLLQWIRGKGLGIKSSITTHFHDDRSAGIEQLNAKDIPTYASRKTNELLQDSGRETARFSLDEGVPEIFQQQGIVTFYPGEGHSTDNIVVWIEEAKVLFGGCLIRSLNTETLGNVADANIGEWAQSVRRVKYQFPDTEIVVPGHGSADSIVLLDHTIAIVHAQSN